MKNQRYEPLELSILQSLEGRMDIPDMKKKQQLEKGYAGEKALDTLLETELSKPFIILRDLTLEVNSSNIIQIDTLLISEKNIYLLEVKNYDGDFTNEEGRWLSSSGAEIKPPLQQLKRSEILFNQLLRELGFSFSVKPYIVFMNSEFHLYGSEPHHPFVFPGQIKRFLQKLNSCSAKLTFSHNRLASKLISLNLKKSPYTRLPVYSYDMLEKGIPCPVCRNFMKTTHSKKICLHCGFVEDTDAAILRCIKEFHILFPGEKITLAGISHWCGDISKKTVRRVLMRNYRLAGIGRGSYYM